MKAILKLVTVCVAVLSLSQTSHADVIYSNLGPADMEIGGPLVVGSAATPYFGLAPAVQNGQWLFQSNGSYSVTSFTLGVDYYLPSLPVSPLFDAYLYSNTQIDGYQPHGGPDIINLPNAVIAEIGQALQAPNSPGLITFSSPTPIALTDTLYWIILTPNNPLTSVVWDSNSLEVDGTLLTPEPSTLTLLSCALPALLFLRKKHPAKP